MQLLLRRRQSPQILNLAVLQPLFVMWGWQLQRFPVALEDDSRHVRVALRLDIATAVVFPAKARRDDQLVQEKHMGCEAMLKFAAILTVPHVLEVPTALVGDHYRHGQPASQLAGQVVSLLS